MPTERPLRGPTRRVQTFEGTAYVEHGWWIVRVDDVDAQTRAATLSEVDRAARLLVSRSIGAPQSSIRVRMTVIRATPTSFVRARWRGSGAP